MESRRPQGTSRSALTSELKRLEIRSSHLDPDGNHCRGTSHHTARHNWYKSHHSRADSSSPANQKHQHRTFRAPSNTAHSLVPQDQVQVPPPGATSFFLDTKPLHAACIPTRWGVTCPSSPGWPLCTKVLGFLPGQEANLSPSLFFIDIVAPGTWLCPNL